MKNFLLPLTLLATVNVLATEIGFGFNEDGSGRTLFANRQVVSNYFDDGITIKAEAAVLTYGESEDYSVGLSLNSTLNEFVDPVLGNYSSFYSLGMSIVDDSTPLKGIATLGVRNDVGAAFLAYSDISGSFSFNLAVDL